MPKKLIAKTQKIETKNPPSSTEFADILIIEPEEKELIQRKGSLYGIYNLKDSTNYETSLLTNLIADILKELYYQSENASPIQALESAISEIKEKVLKLKEESRNGEKSETKLDLMVSTLWGNILYIVKNGKGEVYVVREGDFKKVETVKEGNFAVTTGVVRKGDVVIIATEEFAKRFPPKKLLKLNPNELEDLKNTEKCLMVKFDTEQSEEAEEIKNFGIKPKKANPIEKGAKKIKEMIAKKKGKQKEGIRDLGLQNTEEKNKRWIYYVGIVITAVALAGSIFWTVAKKGPESSTTPEEQPEETATEITETEENPTQDRSVEDNVSTETFYDLKIAESTANPIQLEIIEDTLFAADASGSLFSSEIETAKFERLPIASFENIKGLQTLDDSLYIGTDSGLSVFTPSEEDTQNYDIPITNVFFPYLSALYQVENNQIKKYTLNPGTEENTAEEALWAESEDFVQARDMSISISIYLLTKEGNIVKYTSGTKETFEISGLENALVNPRVLKTKWDWDNMYILDKATNRIVVLTKDGEMVKELRNSAWSDLKDIAITLDETQAFVLSGSKVYQVEL
jgi:hypothetical protein